jgi:hypothetical protein
MKALLHCIVLGIMISSQGFAAVGGGLEGLANLAAHRPARQIERSCANLLARCKAAHTCAHADSARMASTTLPTHATVVLYGDSLQGLQNDLVTMHVRANAFTQIVSVQGSLQWDTAVASFVGITAMGLPSMSNANFGMTQVGNGKLTFSWNDATLQGVSVADGAALFGIEMQLVGAPGSACDLSFPDLPIPMELADTSLSPIADTFALGHLQILDTAVGVLPAKSAPRLRIYPHPIAADNRQFRLVMQGEQARVIDLTLMDARGRRVNEAVKWKLDGQEIVGEISTAAPAGLSLLLIATEYGTITQKIMINEK